MITVQSAMELAAASQIYRYPWDDLPGRPLALIGYGSLINAQSAARNLRTTERRPVLANGVRRVFDYRMPDLLLEKYAPITNPLQTVVLNIRVTRDPQDCVNGILTFVSPDEIPAFRAREVDYDLVPVAYRKYPSGDIVSEPAYTLVCPRYSAKVDIKILPHPDYTALCLAGARDFGEQFEQDFLNTTYLGDGVTALVEWQRDAPNER